MTDTSDTRAPEQLLVELAELHMRTHVSPLPTHPAAFGWQATAGSVSALAARALHALMQMAPEKAAEIAAWYEGPFGEGPVSTEHTRWTEKQVAGSRDVVERWAAEAKSLAVQAAATEDWEKTVGARKVGGAE